MKSNCQKDHPILFRLFYDVTKLEFVCNTKDRTHKFNESFVMYEFICTGLNDNMLAKLKEVYMKEMLNMPGMAEIVLWLTILMNVWVLNICNSITSY